MRRSARRWLALAAAGGLLAATGNLLAGGGSVHAAPHGPVMAAPAGRDEVYAALGVDRVAADYVVLVDTSGSMAGGGRYDQVKHSLRAFFAALAPEDQVTIVAFADRATVVRPAAPAGRSPDALVSKLPRAATGAHTDIGAAIESSVDVLRRPGAPPIATIVLLTDGQHDPPAGSAYPYTQGYSWDQLGRSVARLRKTSINAYAVPLASATGAPLLRKAYPRAAVLGKVAIDRLTGVLEQPKASARAAKARDILGDDAARPVRVLWPAGVRDLGAGRTEMRVELRSTTTHIPLVVDHLTVRTGNPAVRVQMPAGPVELAPGGTATVPVTVDWTGGPRQIAPLSTVTERAELTLAGDVGSGWGQVMAADLGLPLETQLTGGQATAALSAQRGSIGIWAGAGALLSALLGVAWWWRRRRLHPPLAGTLRVRGAGGADREVPLGGQRVALDHGTAGLPGYGEVTARRPAVRATQTMLVIRYSPDGSVAGRAVGECCPGETLRLAGAEFTWQGGPGQRPESAGVADGVPARR